MSTTLDINDELLAKAKAVAAQEQTSLTRLIEEGLVVRLRPQTGRSDSSRPPQPVYCRERLHFAQALNSKESEE